MRGLNILMFVLLLCAPAASAQSATTPKPSTAPVTEQGPAGAAKLPALEVCKVTLPPTPSEKKARESKEPTSCKEKEKGEPIRASLGDSIVLTTSPELGNYLDAIKPPNAVTLFLDGNDTGIAPEALNRKTATLQFTSSAMKKIRRSGARCFVIRSLPRRA